jgi:aromatic-amino-acid transaminase
MFGYTGLSPAQAGRLRENCAICLVRSDRICVAGLNNGNVDCVAGAMADSFRPQAEASAHPEGKRAAPA